MYLIAQSMVEYGGGSGFIGALERTFGTVYAAVGTSLSEHTAVWIVAACVLGYLLLRR